MNLWITVSITLFLLQLATTKFVDKSFPKKVTSTVKPTKSPKSLIDEFTELPPDDVEFIKELDKQFKLHGNRVRIQVERDNSSVTTKNSKRTIDGEVGYGYRQVSNPNAYRFTFSRPRYMVYPYSQHDIPPTAGGKAGLEYQRQHLHPHQHHQVSHHHVHPSQLAEVQNAVQIQPSHAYEIKETDEGYQTYTSGGHHGHQQVYVPQYQQQRIVPFQPHAHQQQVLVQEQYAEPVIVLRIPGPAKYAAHLQALLQQYLEIRAAQYIRELEEQEARQHQQQQHHQEQHEEEQQHQQQEQQAEQPAGSYEQYQEQVPAVTPAPHPVYHHHHHHHQQVRPVYQQVQYQPQQPVAHHQTYGSPVAYESSAEVDSRHQQIREHLHKQLHIEEANVYEPNEQQQAVQAPVYQTPAPTPVYDVHPNVRTYLHPVHHHVVYGPPSDSEYATATVSTVASHATRPSAHAAHNHIDEHPDLPISENFPRNTHTKVVFTGKDNDDNTSSYPLTPLPPTAASFVHAHRKLLPQFQTPSSVLLEQRQREKVVAITQRPRGPFNYHAHLPSSTFRPPVKSSKYETPYSDEHFRKLNKLINRLKRKNASHA